MKPTIIALLCAVLLGGDAAAVAGLSFLCAIGLRRSGVRSSHALLCVTTFWTQAAATATPLGSFDKSSSEHAPHDLDRLISTRLSRASRLFPASGIDSCTDA